MARTGMAFDRWLGPGAALALGAATAFFSFAMPASVMAAGLDAIGLTMLTPVTAPVRMVVIAVAALLAAVPTWYGFRQFDRRGSHWRDLDDRLSDYEDEDDAFIDIFDAPPRPISVEAEVGEPLLLDTPFVDVPRATIPANDIVNLLDRLEQGLRRRSLAPSRMPPEMVDDFKVTPIHPSNSIREPADDALRSALAELQRIAGQRA